MSLYSQFPGAIARKHAVTSVNSMLRQARSLFGERKVLKHIEIPRPHLFEGVEFEPKVDPRFWGAGISAPDLRRKALKELDNCPASSLRSAAAIGRGSG
jgi:hypothetical protein